MSVRSALLSHAALWPAISKRIRRRGVLNLWLRQARMVRRLNPEGGQVWRQAARFRYPQTGIEQRPDRNRFNSRSVILD
jgi:hypothetical protein